MRFGVKGAALLQAWLMVFGFVGIVFMMSGVSGADARGSGMGDNPTTPGGSKITVASTLIPVATNFWSRSGDAGLSEVATSGAEKAVAETAAEKVVAENTDSYLANMFGLTKGGDASSLVSGLQWATIAYFAGTMVGGMLGMSDDNSQALGVALAAGLGAYKALSTWTTTAGGTGLMSPALIGLGVAAVIFVLMYKDTETKIVSFDCMPWQAPNGGNDCEVCNDDSLPCSEYRCKSLGQGCEIVNSGTEEEKCVYVNPRDVDPPVISPNYDALSVGYEYKNVKNSPPGPGFEIENVASSDGCLKAFTPLEFGFTLDEPGQCKIDFNHTEKFDNMAAYIGGNNLYSYNHSDVFSLPSASNLEGSGFVLENGKDLTFFVRCKDKNGNENGAEYAVNFCIDPSPDSTAPRIEATSIDNDGCVAENQSDVNVVFYANEPSDCKWSFQDKDYDLMENGMSCSSNYRQSNAAQLFGCSADLTGIARTATTFYVRCKDQPEGDEADRNKNGESFAFRLRGSEGLVLKNLRPNETISVGISPAPVELYVETLFGCNNGKSVCAWSDDGSDYIQFFDTNNDDGVHTQRLDLAGGNHEYFVRCVDGGGNLVEDSIDFDISVDQSPPVIARVYEEGGMLKVVTVRDSECAYTHTDCDFSFEEGVEMPYGNTTIHVADWDEENTYFIKCRDEFQNVGSGCSIIVRPSANFL